jgi:hypothetical protein
LLQQGCFPRRLDFDFDGLLNVPDQLLFCHTRCL